MQVLFCRPISPQAQDDRLDIEAEALDELGVVSHVIDMELVVDGEVERAVELLPEWSGPLLYRGWMLSEEEYEQLYEALYERGYELITHPGDYALAHYLPNYYHDIEDLTAPTVWIEGTDLGEAWEAAHELGSPPYVLKDHVKSVKEDWHGCCLIPRDADRATFDSICAAFIEARGERFERGLVFRRFLPLKPLPDCEGDTTRNEEHRLFFWRGDLIASAPYHDSWSEMGDLSQFRDLGKRIRSNFFTADVARLITDDWTVIEIGDGGVSTLPPLMNPLDLYRPIVANE